MSHFRQVYMLVGPRIYSIGFVEQMDKKNPRKPYILIWACRVVLDSCSKQHRFKMDSFVDLDRGTILPKFLNETC